MRCRVSVATGAKGSANKGIVSAVNNDGAKSVEGARRLGQSSLQSEAHPLDSGFSGNAVDDFRSGKAIEVIGMLTTVAVTVAVAVVGQSYSDEGKESNKSEFVHDLRSWSCCVCEKGT